VPPSRRSSNSQQRLTVAVTGPTGDIGASAVAALERSRAVKKIVGMARSPFDPTERGWKKTEYRRGDVLDRAAVDELVRGADVVVHLAFAIMGSLEDTRAINLEGSRNVFEAAIAAGAKRLVYTSSVAAYGFHEDNPQPLVEEVEPRGTDEHYYSAQKAEVERLLADLAAGAKTDVYVFRPCIVAGADALMLLEQIPYIQLREKVPDAVVRMLDFMPALRPVIPDNSVPFQLVHTEDVATAIRAAVIGRGKPGVYNLAGEGQLTMADLAGALGWYSIPIPELAVDAAAELIERLPFAPTAAQWIQALRTPVLMDTAKARRQLGWRPRHDARETLADTIAGARDVELV
jgi:nucleoside-diphosphate-sugar epimerase